MTDDTIADDPGDAATLPPAASLIDTVLGDTSAQLDKGTAPPSDLGLRAASAVRYAVGAELARGGMGAVLSAKDLNLRRDVAMKVVLEPGRVRKHQILRFIHEAQVTGQLEHPGIVPVYELGVDAENKAFYTMKFIRGTTLGDVLKGIRGQDQALLEHFPLPRLLDIFIKACDALAFAHSRGVIHRDLKPDNIMVGDFGEVLIVDWGLAKVLGDVGAELPEDADAYSEAGATEDTVVESVRDSPAALNTLDGAILGTPAYMPPEQADGDLHALGPLADVYAMGAILYTILTLEAPVTGATVDELLENVRSGAITAPESGTQAHIRTA